MSLTPSSPLISQADAVVLPYHGSSSSGPLHIAMSAGLPIVVTAVGGLVEAVRDYKEPDGCRHGTDAPREACCSCSPAVASLLRSALLAADR